MLTKIIKKYGYYILALSLILVVGVSVGLTGGEGVPATQNPNNAGQTSATSVQMVCPIESPEVLKWYSDTELFYNSTLKQWESHRGVDLTSGVSNDVVAVLDGVVSGCSYSYEDGYCVTITHDNGLTTMYCSLQNCDAVKRGDTVSKGQKIGEISTTAANESGEGNHLHFSIQLNGQNVDPANYLTFENK